MRKKLKRLLRLRNSAGFTLVEMVIACALLGILIVGILGFITPILSSVREQEKNARATMLSKAIDDYIAAATQYAYYVTTFSGAATSDTVGSPPPIAALTYSGSEFAKKNGKGLNTLMTSFGKMKADTFEIRCIGLRWRLDPVSGTRKIMLTNESVDQTTLGLNSGKSKLVFEECFYDGLYPVVTFGNYTNEYEVGGVPQVTGSDVDIAPGLMISTSVYTTPSCYNTDSTVRENAMLSTEGIAYTGFNNIKNPLINRGDYEVIPNLEVNSYDDALTKDSALSFTEDGEEYYYPESFIYYIVRKTKTENVT